MHLSEELRRFLEEKRFAVMATIAPDGMPQQSVMWYVLEGDEILMNTLRGRKKEENMARDPRVSLCFEDEYQWLTLIGRARLIDDPEQGQADIRRLAIRYHGEEKGRRQSEELFAPQERVSIRFTIERVIAHGF